MIYETYFQLNVINDEDEEEEEVPELKPKRPTDLPLKSVGWKSPDFDYPEEHVESEDPKLSRVMSDDVLTRPVAQVRPRKTSECFEERPIDPDLQKKKKKSRFTIEPVTPVDPPKTEKTKEKKRQSSLKVIRRRNAFSSVSLQGKADDYEEGLFGFKFYSKLIEIILQFVPIMFCSFVFR